MLNQSSELEYNEYNEYNELNSDEEELFMRRRAFEDYDPFPLDLAEIEKMQNDDEQLRKMTKNKRCKQKIEKLWF